MRRSRSNLEITCPHCGARLKIDSVLGKVIAHDAPPKRARAPDLDQAAKHLQEEAARREGLFKQSAEEEKIKAQLLERKFEESLKKTKDTPPTPPIRDIDLD